MQQINVSAASAVLETVKIYFYEIFFWNGIQI